MAVRREEALTDWLASNYCFEPPILCRLLRAYTNDVYTVETPNQRFVLKLYGPGWRTEAEIRYEVSLLQHLAAKGLRIASPLPDSRDEAVHWFAFPNDDRYAVLFEYAEGEKPVPPFTLSLYRAFGQAIARMHALSEDFVTAYPRVPLDVTVLIDASLDLALPLIEAVEDRAFLADLAQRARHQILEKDAEGLDWGPIHGDASLDNLHLTREGDVLLFDFDSGGPGWRAADLQGWAAGSADYLARGDAFRQGYSKVRPLRENDLRAAPYLTIAWDIWGLQIDLRNRILKQGKDATQSYLAGQIALLHARERTLISP